MNLPLRSLAVFAAGLMCLETCFAVSAGKAPEAGTALLRLRRPSRAKRSSFLVPCDPSFEWPE